MPELPEVETCRQGIEPYIKNSLVEGIVIRQWQLRWPIPKTIHELKQQRIEEVNRRGKYILLETQGGTALIHLGMSGRLHILPHHTPIQKHDHVDILFNNGLCLRYNDSRRFGTLLWTHSPPNTHPLLSKLGPEPLSDDFNAKDLWHRAKQSKRAIKLVIMDSQIVVGVGNIYANEALFLAGILPQKAAHTLSKKNYATLTTAIKTVLAKALAAGGTTLKDFQNIEGKPGYFQQDLMVYGRENKPCIHCNKPLTSIRLGQRSTVFCAACQS